MKTMLLILIGLMCNNVLTEGTIKSTGDANHQTQNKSYVSYGITDFHLSSIEDNAFNLNWKLDETVNSDNHQTQLILQKSTTGTDFENILLPKSKENYRDWDVKKNLQYYYRLKIITDSEKVQFSNVVTASLSIRSSILNASIFPNPTDKQLKLQVHVLEAGEVKCSILDASGQVAKSFNHIIDSGLNEFQIDIESLISNQYFLQIEFKNDTLIRPFTKL